MSTSPFDESVAQLLAQTHEQTLAAVAVVGATTYPLDVDPESWSVDWSETRTPRVFAQLTCAAPAEAVIAALDPRTMVFVKLTIGYRLASGVHDAHQLADLVLRRRTVNRPANTMVLEATSHDGVLLDASADLAVPLAGQTTYASATACIRAIITSRLSTGPLAGPTIVSTTTDAAPFTCDVNPGDYWAVIESAADSIGAVVFDNGDGVFRIEPRRYDVDDTDAAVTLTVGANGTILDSQTEADRDEWANFVTIDWTWTNADDSPGLMYGQSWVSAGPFAPASAGVKGYFEHREAGYMTTAAAKAAARSVLLRLLARSRRYRIQAVSAWWLRPGMTVTIQLPTGAQERHLVASVGFAPGGRMTIETRLPDTASTIGE